MLEKIGLELSPSIPGKLPVISHKAVIRTLVIEGFAKADIGSAAAEQVLRRNCKPADLAQFNNVFAESLRKHNGSYLYLAAKAKTREARPFVEEMAMLPFWRNVEERFKIVQIARAALGNNAVEDEFIQGTFEAEKDAPPAPSNRFHNVGSAKDGKEVGNQLNTLGLIGTRKSLQVACAFLRSRLKSYVPDVSERSIREDLLAAIQYNFPNQGILQRRRSTQEWSAAENFCVENLGAAFDGPTPNIPPAQAYPRLR